MKTFPESIASTWGEVDNMSPWLLFERDSIATESHQEEFPAWQKSIDALLELWKEPSIAAEGGDEPPSRLAIEATISWLIVLRTRFPIDPPTYVVAEPGGGIIVERRTISEGGYSRISELTFYNNGEVEFTVYLDGRITTVHYFEAMDWGTTHVRTHR